MSNERRANSALQFVPVITNSPEETLRLGRKLAQNLRSGDILCLYGELGSGKTTLVKGIAEGLEISPHKVQSPTFVLMNAYEGKLPLYHFDLYRLENTRQIMMLDYEEYFYGGGVTVIEWADRLKELTPRDYLRVEFTFVGDNERSINLVPLGKRYEELAVIR